MKLSQDVRETYGDEEISLTNITGEHWRQPKPDTQADLQNMSNKFRELGSELYIKEVESEAEKE